MSDDLFKSNIKRLTKTLSPFRTRYLAKDEITFYPDHTISYRLPLGAIFEPSMSVGSEDDKITTLDLVVVVSEHHPTVQ